MIHTSTILLFAAYMLPTWIAGARHHPRGASIAILNFFLGWTFVGWVIALAMAAGPVQPQAPR